MKPFIWMNKDHRAEFDGAKGDLGLTVPVWNDSLNQYAKSKGLKPMDVPLYTADQLAEAVTAERERVAEFLTSFWAASSLEEEDISVTVKIKVPFVPHEKTVSTILRSIRSAAK